MKKNEKLNKFAEKFEDIRTKKVLGFFVAKGLLINAHVKPTPTVKISISELLWVGEHVEPRVFEVFPAAFLRFKKTFLHVDQLPDIWRRIIEQINSGEKSGADYCGIKYADMLRWAEQPLRDRRTKPISNRRKLRAYRLPQSVITALHRAARKAGLSDTEYLVSLIERAV